MKLCMVTSVSDGTSWSALTTPNHAEWCERHGATFVARYLPYDQAVSDFSFLEAMLGHFDAVWCLDSDAVITHIGTPLEGVRRGMNVCQEGLGLSPPINCGSVVWAGEEAVRVFRALRAAEPEWRRLTWIWQEWLGDRLDMLGELVTVHAPDAFNGCHHGDTCVWKPGGFIYHPCGMPQPQRTAAIRQKLEEVVR